MILRITCSWKFHQRCFLKKILFSDYVIYLVLPMYVSQFKNHFWWYKSLVLFSSQSKKIFISGYDMIIFIDKSWSANSSWLTLFVRSKVTRGDSFDFEMLLIISLQEQNFEQVHCFLTYKNQWNLQFFLAAKSV